MKTEGLRKVEFKPNSFRDDILIGYFHQWGFSYTESNGSTGLVNFSIGIIEDEKGQVYSVETYLIKFLD